MTQSAPVRRITLRACPTEAHRKYFRWQQASICIFVADFDPDHAVVRALQRLKEERWNLLKLEETSTLIEDRVREQGGEVWDAYREAQQGRIFFRAWVDGVTGDKADPLVPLVPRLTEAFIDRVVSRAGGRRLTLEERNFEKDRNADYLLGDAVIELKILEQEGLEIDTRQAKLAELFGRAVGPYDTIEIDPRVLTDEELRRYCDIVGGPIKNALKSASKQIRKTKEHLKQPELRGIALVVNTGYGTLPPELLYHLTQRYASKDTSQVVATAAISTWLVPGNLFDCTMYYGFQPHETSDPVLGKLKGSFSEAMDEFMTKFIRDGMLQEGNLIEPQRPLTFEKDGIIFSSMPHE